MGQQQFGAVRRIQAKTQTMTQTVRGADGDIGADRAEKQLFPEQTATSG